MKTPFLAGPVPRELVTDRVRLRPLGLHDAVKDFEAVMLSRREIFDCFGPGTGWPTDELTLEEDIVDLCWHQKEFAMGGSFTFTVLSLDCKACLGCLYVLPSERAGFSAQVIYWARTGEAGLDEHLGAAVRGWLATAWPWPAGSVAFPGRDQKWVDWLALPVK